MHQVDECGDWTVGLLSVINEPWRNADRTLRTDPREIGGLPNHRDQPDFELYKQLKLMYPIIIHYDILIILLLLTDKSQKFTQFYCIYIN